MIWNTIPNDERLHLWKKLREDIKQLSVDEQLKEVAKFCSEMPFGCRTLDYYSTEFWPTPWEILFHGSFCTSSISLLMYYTLTLLDTPPSVELHLVEDTDGIYLLPIIDNRFVLKYINTTLGNEDFESISNSVMVFKNKGQLQIKSALQDIGSITVYDILGREVFEKDNINQHDFKADNVVMNTQTIIVKVKLKNGMVVTKKVIY